MQDNFKKLMQAQKKFASRHKFFKYHHKYSLGELELIYRQFFASDNHKKMELAVSKQFDSCDMESLSVIEKFIGD